MEDLFVIPEARGTGVAERLIRVCSGLCHRRGVARLSWQTAPDNHRAQRLYDRIGGIRSQWIDYVLPTDPPPGESPVYTPATASIRPESTATRRAR